jgi:hypothetical protein
MLGRLFHCLHAGQTCDPIKAFVDPTPHVEPAAA